MGPFTAAHKYPHNTVERPYSFERLRFCLYLCLRFSLRLRRLLRGLAAETAVNRVR